jgi:hypothetical protein
VLTALGERDGAVRDAELRAGGALLAMTDDEGLSMHEAVEWCGGGLTLREVTRLRRLAAQPSGVVQGERAARRCSGSGRPTGGPI